MFFSLDKDLQQSVLREVRVLPQVLSGAVSEDQISKWLDQVARIDPTRIAWHVRRLGGIGGSEIASVMGLHGAYSSPDIIARQKLMLIPPFRASAAMRRGAVSEDFIRDMFETSSVTATDLEITENQRSNELSTVIQTFFTSELDKRFGHGTWRPRPDLEMLIQRPRERGKLPAWAIASPDRIYEIQINGAPCIVPVDFKAPSEATMKEIRRDSGKLNPWRAQVQYIGGILDDCGHPPAAVVLAVFDYANVGTNTFLIDEAVFTKDVFNLFISAGNKFWNEHVLTGALPERPSPVVAEPPAEVRRAAEMSAYVAAMRDAARDELEAMQAPMRQWILEDPENRGGAILGQIDDTAVWNPRVKPVFDGEAAIFRLIDIGHISPEDSLKLRGPAEPMPPSDPRFLSSLTVARDKIEILRQMADGLEPGASLSEEFIKNMKTILAEASENTRPYRPGAPKPDLVKKALADAGEPRDTYLSTEVTLARSGTKASSVMFKVLTSEAREIVVAHAVRSSQDVADPNPEPAATTKKTVNFQLG
jgi:hypothetical protein